MKGAEILHICIFMQTHLVLKKSFLGTPDPGDEDSTML
jgi:hypothetical protein